MPTRGTISTWFRLPSRIALALGIGAISAAGAKADVKPFDRSEPASRVPQQSVKVFGELRVWSEEGRIYLSEGDQEARELRLDDTPEARHLRALLERDGAVAGAPRVLPHRIILVGGGGSGFDWATDKSQASATPPGATGATGGAQGQDARQPTANRRQENTA